MAECAESPPSEMEYGALVRVAFIITGRGMNGMVGICIWNVGKFLAGTVACGVFANLENFV